MRLKKTYDSGNLITYEISIGGYVQLRLKNASRYRAQLMMRSADTTQYVMNPLVLMNNNVLLMTAWAVMCCHLEAARRRYAHEEINAYLAARWHQALEDMGVPYRIGPHEVGLTARVLCRSPAMKKMRGSRA